MLAVAAALQSSVVVHIRLLGGGPDLVFLIVMSWAVYANVENSIVLALIGGIMLDLLSAAPIGSSAFGLIILVFAISGIGQRVYQVGIVLLLGMVIAGTFIQQISVTSIMALTGHRVDLGTVISYVVLPTLFYNLVLVLPVYWVIRRIQGRLWRTVSSIR